VLEGRIAERKPLCWPTAARQCLCAYRWSRPHSCKFRATAGPCI